MRFKELVKKPAAEREKQLVEARMELMKRRAQASSAGGKETGKIRQIKRDIARILTIKNKEVIEKR